MVAVEARYRAKARAHIPSKDVEAIGRELREIAERNDQGISAHMVVEAARDPASAMHGYFEWDDSVAAHQHRLNQARTLIRSIEITVVTKPGPNPERAPVRAYHHVRVSEPEEEPKARYVPLDVVKSRQALLDQVVAHAYKEMIGWRERYRTYQSFKEFAQFKTVFDEIDRIEREARPQARRPPAA